MLLNRTTSSLLSFFLVCSFAIAGWQYFRAEAQEVPVTITKGVPTIGEYMQAIREEQSYQDNDRPEAATRDTIYDDPWDQIIPSRY